MALIEEGSRISPGALRSIYDEHREEIASIARSFRDRPSPVVDPGRWSNGVGLAEAALRILPARAEEVEPQRLTDFVNLSYELMVGLIFLMKAAYGLPMVPAPRR